MVPPPPLPLHALSWYPGHMVVALRNLTALLQKAHIVIEVRDARIPISSINNTLATIGEKQTRIVVYNKIDLVSEKEKAKLIRYCKIRKRKAIIQDLDHGTETRPELHRATDMHSSTQTEQSIQSTSERLPEITETSICTNGMKTKTIQQILNTIRQHFEENSLQTRQSSKLLKVVMIGMPNVGKSTLLNGLRRVGTNRGASSRTGAKPGVTRKLESLVKILDPTAKCPAVYIVDSPGIMVTRTKDVETSIKLALSGGIKDDITHEGLEWICRYLLWTLNRHEQYQYVTLCGLVAPTSDFDAMIVQLACRLGAYGHKGALDTERAMRWLIREYREGRCGSFMLDQLPEDNRDSPKRICAVA